MEKQAYRDMFMYRLLKTLTVFMSALLIVFAALFIADIKADAASISKCTVSAITLKHYTGKAIKPSVTVKYNGKTLKLNTDYVLTYKNNVNAGNASVTVTGKGKYSGSVTKKFTIAKVSINTLSADKLANRYYTGSAIKPVPALYFSGKKLKSGTDFSVYYSKNTNVGTATVTIRGKTNFTGTRSFTFKINKLPLSKAKISVPAQYYTGKAIKPAAKVTYNSATYKLNRDYTVTYKNNTKVGTATVTVKGKGGLSGTKSVTFKISKLPLSKAKISVSAVTYSGKAQKPAVKVTYGSTTYKSGTNYTVSYKNNTNAGTASVTVKAKSGMSGSKTVTFKINKKSLSSASVSVSAVTFNGSAQKPTPTVKVSGAALKKDKDFTVSYSSNTSAGTATVKITGKGNYSGTVNKTFTIKQCQLSKVTLAAQAQYSPDGTVGSVAGKYGAYTLKASELSYTLPTAAGKHEITVSGSGNFTGTAKVTVEVKPADISKSVASVTEQGGAYGMSVTYGKHLLVCDEDYTLSSQENDGVLTLTATGKGNYAGTLSAQKELLPPDTITVDTIAGVTYTGGVQLPVPVVRFNGEVLDKNLYSVIYKNNINVGTAVIEIRGTGELEGLTAQSGFEITPAQISKAEGKCATVYFAGKALTPKPVLTFGGKELTSGTDYNVTSYKNNDRVGTASLTVTGKGNFTGTKTISFEIKADKTTSDTAERQKIKARLDEMMAGKYGRQINSYWHSYKLGEYYNTLRYSPCTCHSFCNNGYEDGCTCLIGRSTVLGSDGAPFVGIQCAGFAFEVFDYLFAGTNQAGDNTLTRFGSDRGNWSVKGIKEEFTERLRPGDYLAYTNEMYGYDHYVIVYDVDDEGVWVYEANFGGRCKINLRLMTFEEFYEQTDDIYHRTPDNYKLSDM